MQALRGIAGSDDAAVASWQAELAAVLGWWRLDPLGVSHLRAAGTARAAGVERAKVALAQQDVLRRLEAAGEKRAALRNQLQDLAAEIAVLESDAEKLARVADTALAADRRAGADLRRASRAAAASALGAAAFAATVVAGGVSAWTLDTATALELDADGVSRWTLDTATALGPRSWRTLLRGVT